MPAKTGQVEFSATVPAEEYEEFKNNFPAYGAVKWFINECLSSFNRKMRENPSLKQVVTEAIDDVVR